MTKLSKKTALSNWLNDRFDNRQNGVIFTESESNYFEVIQDFLEDKDRLLQTPAIQGYFILKRDKICLSPNCDFLCA